MSNPMPIVVLFSGGGTNLEAIITAADRGTLPVTVVAAVTNNPAAGGIAHAEAAGVPVEVVDHRRYADRAAFDAALRERIDAHDPQLVVLAGFMRVLTDAFVDHYPGRMLNVHPSLLPRHTGLDTHRRALEAGNREHGSSVHFVTRELDGGPVVVQARVPVHPGDTPESLEARVRPWEYIILPQAIRLFAEGRLRLEDNAPTLDGRPLAQPLPPDTEPKEVQP